MSINKIRFGDIEPTKICYGDIEVTKAYLGDNLIYEVGEDYDWFRITNIEKSYNSTIYIVKTGSPGIELEYSLNGRKWIPITNAVGYSLNSEIPDGVFGEPYEKEDVIDKCILTEEELSQIPSVMSVGDEESETITLFTLAQDASFQLNAGETLYLRGTITGTYDVSNYITIKSNYRKYSVSGDIKTLLQFNNIDEVIPCPKYGCYYLFYSPTGTNYITDISGLKLSYDSLSDYSYANMFYGCNQLQSIPENFLPSTSLGTFCYYNMFYGCSSITSLPENLLPAQLLTSSCYRNMFNGCTNLVNAPNLPAVTLSSNCYGQMFYKCSKLTNPPTISATKLAIYCCQGMFTYCTSLTTAPELKSTSISSYSYKEMFAGCSKLNYVKCWLTGSPSTNYLSNWLASVASTGTFVTPSGTNWTEGTNGIPSGWTRVNL